MWDVVLCLAGGHALRQEGEDGLLLLVRLLERRGGGVVLLLGRALRLKGKAEHRLLGR